GKPVECIPWTKLGSRGSFSDSLVVDPVRGGFWLGFWRGGVVHFKDGEVRASFGTANGLGGGRVNALKLDPDGTLWAATDGGLSRIKDDHITTLTGKNGLPCDTIHDLIDDDVRSSWLYTACGLVRVARSELDAWAAEPQRKIQATVFDSSDGIRSHAGVYYPAPRVAKAADGKLWFLPLDGVSVVDPLRLSFNKISPPVHVEQIVADGKTYEAVTGLRLPPRVRDLSIDFTALSFVAPEKVHFRFKLEGQDTDWREVVNRRRVEYSNLPPRHYRFRVLACNDSGVWNEEGAALDFAVDPAYWQTNWFRALVVLTFLAMLWTVYQLRVNAFERRQTALEQHQALLERHQAEIRALNEQMIKAQEAERMRISGDLHDGVLQQITSLALQLGTAKRQLPGDSEVRATMLGLQQELIQVGADIRHISHELHPALLQESGLPAALSAYCEEFSKVRGLPVECETDKSVEELSPGAALCLYRIAQEALGNAAKYSQAKKLEVRLTRANGSVRLLVADDGVGCDPEKILRSGGLGVINMRERVMQLHGAFEFDSAPGRGTRVRAEIPFRSAK
ncbi:MAG TPA: ATP-binding protein, partial [Terriglobales bacterium]|nr:ATP-binding protein [Terriglobales bacterium]